MITVLMKLFILINFHGVQSYHKEEKFNCSKYFAIKSKQMGLLVIAVFYLGDSFQSSWHTLHSILCCAWAGLLMGLWKRSLTFPILFSLLLTSLLSILFRFKLFLLIYTQNILWTFGFWVHEWHTWLKCTHLTLCPEHWHPTDSHILLHATVGRWLNCIA